MKNKSMRLLEAVKGFTTDYLPRQKGAGENTIASYRTSLNLYLDYWKEQLGCQLYELQVESIPSGRIHEFFDSLEEKRGCSVKTRNQRLSGIRSFYKYAACRDPVFTQQCQEVLAIPKKKEPRKAQIEFFSEKALEAMLRQPDTKKANGYRDFVFLTLLYDTGGRIDEIISLTEADLHLVDDSQGRHVVLNGKGRKDRMVPLMEKTAGLLEDYTRRFHADGQAGKPLFYVHHRQGDTRLSEDCVESFVKKYADLARKECPEVPGHVYPHMWRHSRAMHLYRNGMSLYLVAEWLGHSNVETTMNFYANANASMKSEAIKAATSNLNALIQQDTDIYWEEDEELIRRLYGLK